MPVKILGKEIEIKEADRLYTFKPRKNGRWRITIEPNTKNEEVLWGTLKDANRKSKENS